MCGICGTVGFSDKYLLKRMTDTLGHRGPDAEGFYMDTDVGLGVRRLRVIDLVTGDQPIHNEDESIWIVSNGEIYNFKELKVDLLSKGHKFYTSSDTEVIVHLYEEYSQDCLKYLDGMFAFAVWDKKERRLFLARDRVGIKPLYYYQRNGEFLFASELKALLKFEKIPKDLNPEALDFYLSFLYIPSPITIFRDIHKLPPAHYLTLKDAKVEIKKYWDLPVFNSYENPKRLNLGQMIDILRDSIRSRLISDVPLGAFLSGGIDSSTVVGIMSKLINKPVKTFSIGYDKRFDSYNELKFSNMVSNFFNTEHKVFIIRPDIIKILPKIVWHLDEPFADSSAILTYLISKEAKREVTVALTGIGGDELFGGYPRYIGAKLSLIYENLPLFLRKSFAEFSNFIPESTSSTNVGGRIRRFLKAGLLDEGERYINWLLFFNKDMKQSLYTKDIKASLKNFSYDYLHKYFFKRCKSKDYLDKIFYVDINTYLPEDLLVMADRMSMANSLEVRVPFCDHKLIEFMATVPYGLRIKGLKLKGLLKNSLKGFLPPEVLHKPKRGFMIPIGDWIKEELKDYIFDLLNKESIKKRGFFNYSFIRNLLEDHFKAKRVYTHHIYALLILELWLRIYLDNR